MHQCIKHVNASMHYFYVIFSQIGFSSLPMICFSNKTKVELAYGVTFQFHCFFIWIKHPSCTITCWKIIADSGLASILNSGNASIP